MEYWNEYIKKARDCGYKFVSWNVWNRSGSGGSVGAITALFPIEHEFIFIFCKEVHKDDINKTKINKHAGQHRSGGDRQKDGSLIHKNRKINPNRRLGTVQTIDFERNIEYKQLHPAVFPIQLPAEFISAILNEDMICIDPFLGAGTTLIACEQLNRICYGMELDLIYCDVIIQRWEKFTGQKAHLQEVSS